TETELPQLAGRLALAALVHRDEYRIQRSVRMHAAGPLTVVIRMAALARLRALQLLACQGARVRCRVALRGRRLVAVTRGHQQQRQRRSGPGPALLRAATAPREQQSSQRQPGAVRTRAAADG